MKALKLLAALVVLGAASANPAWADRGRAHVGVMIGVPLYAPAYYPPYYYYPPYSPPVVIERTAPPVYIQQQVAPEQAPAANVWYFCAAANAYYPYVKDCPGGWQQVQPQPPTQP